MKSDIKYIEHILESIKYIEHFMKGVTSNEFFENVEKQYAVVRALEIIGEAVKNISSEYRTNYPYIPWREIAGTRDILIHAYFSVDLPAVWDMVDKDLPDLKQKLKDILNKEE